MMSKKEVKPKVKPVIKSATTDKVGVSVFYLYDLREHSQELFGVKPEVLDGAFFNVKEAQISKEDAKKYIETFLNKEVGK